MGEQLSSFTTLDELDKHFNTSKDSQTKFQQSYCLNEEEFIKEYAKNPYVLSISSMYDSCIDSSSNLDPSAIEQSNPDFYYSALHEKTEHRIQEIFKELGLEKYVQDRNLIKTLPIEEQKEIVCNLGDYLANRLTYDVNVQNHVQRKDIDENKANGLSLYYTVCEDRGVCKDFSVCFSELLNRIGIQSETISERGALAESHVVSSLTIGSERYVVDMTESVRTKDEARKNSDVDENFLATLKRLGVDTAVFESKNAEAVEQPMNLVNIQTLDQYYKKQTAAYGGAGTYMLLDKDDVNAKHSPKEAEYLSNLQKGIDVYREFLFKTKTGLDVNQSILQAVDITNKVVGAASVRFGHTQSIDLASLHDHQRDMTQKAQELRNGNQFDASQQFSKHMMSEKRDHNENKISWLEDTFSKTMNSALSAHNRRNTARTRK